MKTSLTTRLATMSRPELIAGVGVALIVSGIVLRFLGSAVVLQVLILLRSMPDEAITLAIQAFSLLEILVGIALLVWVAAHIRNRTRMTSESDNRTAQP